MLVSKILAANRGLDLWVHESLFNGHFDEGEIFLVNRNARPHLAVY